MVILDYVEWGQEKMGKKEKTASIEHSFERFRCNGKDKCGAITGESKGFV